MSEEAVIRKTCVTVCIALTHTHTHTTHTHTHTHYTTPHHTLVPLAYSSSQLMEVALIAATGHHLAVGYEYIYPVTLATVHCLTLRHCCLRTVKCFVYGAIVTEYIIVILRPRVSAVLLIY